MAGGETKTQFDISDLIADLDAPETVDLVVLLQDVYPANLSELVGGEGPHGTLRVEAVGSGEALPPTAATSLPSAEGASPPAPLTIIFDDAANDPTTAI